MTKSRQPKQSTLPKELQAIINANKRRPVLGAESVRRR